MKRNTPDYSSKERSLSQQTWRIFCDFKYSIAS